jgi:hypothetical protein
MAGGGSSIRAGRAFVELYLEDNRFKRSLDAAQSRLSSFAGFMAKAGAGLGVAGLAAYGALDALESRATSQAVAFGRIADRLGGTAEGISALAYAVGTTGVSLEDLEGHFENLNERIAQAVNGTGEGIVAFQRLGISAADMAKDLPEEQLVRLSKAMKQVTNDTERLGILSSLGGDQFQKLNPFLKLGEKEIRRRFADAKAFGLVVTSEQASRAAEVTYAYHQMFSAIEGVTLAIGYALIPSRQFMDNWVGGVRLAAIAIREWIENNGDLIQTIEMGVYATLGLAAAFAAVSVASYVLGAAMKGLLLPVTLFTTAVGLLTPLSTISIGLVSAAWGLLTGAVSLGSAAGTAALGLLGAAKAAFSTVWVASSATSSGAWATFVAVFEIGKAIITGGLSLLVLAVMALPVAIVAATGYWLIFTTSGRKAAAGLMSEVVGAARGVGESLSGYLGAVFDNLSRGWKLIANAVGRGDLNAAWQLTMAMLETEAARAIAALTRVWNDFQTNHLDHWKRTWTGIKTHTLGVISAIKIALGTLTNPATSFFDGLKNGLITLWNRVRGGKDPKGPAGGPGENEALAAVRRQQLAVRNQALAAGGQMALVTAALSGVAAMPSAIASLGQRMSPDAKADSTNLLNRDAENKDKDLRLAEQERKQQQMFLAASTAGYLNDLTSWLRENQRLKEQGVAGGRGDLLGQARSAIVSGTAGLSSSQTFGTQGVTILGQIKQQAEKQVAAVNRNGEKLDAVVGAIGKLEGKPLAFGGGD